ncbi:hypothetical protein [Lacticaseibacillus sp. GG6-2]
MTDDRWLLQQAQQAEEAATTYEDKAFYLALQDFIREQTRRLDQAEGELDGTLWDHERW